jgi:DNA-binding transcriptional MerR regulator
MHATNEPPWTIEQLTAQVALALSVDYDGPGDSRAREIPDLRTIRYYITLGLIDRPQAMRGRTALYGRRHLLQLVAIKRLQANGLTLAQLQERLLGMTDAALAEVAKLPDVGPKEARPERRDEAFWSKRPAPPPALHEASEGQSDLPMQGIRLDGQVTLLLTPGRIVDVDDVQAIRAAAGPLLKLLNTRRLLARQQAREDPSE